MSLEDYNRTYEEIVTSFDEEADARLREIRRQCAQGLITRINNRQREWNEFFQDLLNKSQEIDTPPPKPQSQLSQQEQSSTLTPFGGESLFSTSGALSFQSLASSTTAPDSVTKQSKENIIPDATEPDYKETETTQTNEIRPKLPDKIKQPEVPKKESPSTDPHFSNAHCIKEYIRLQKLLEQNREAYGEITTQPHLKEFKVNLYRFIRTQINTITNDDPEHLDNKVKMLTNLLAGQRVIFQDQVVDASQHPQGRLYSYDMTSETFVTVGKKLIDSKPAYAKSIAAVVKGIVENNNPLLTDLITGHLQERCPYLVPMYPNINDLPAGDDREYRYKVACGYSHDFKSKGLESDEKYHLSMRSMALFYGSMLVQLHIDRAWTWLASFLNLKPKPVISALILQAFLQEASKEMSKVYGCQFKKLVSFIRNDYIKLLEEITKIDQRQSLEKLKNLMEADSNLFAAPSASSIFGVVRLGA